jgi:hypothetical protein
MSEHRKWGSTFRFGPCKHGEVIQNSSGRLRTAKAEDGAQLLRLWALLFDEGDTTSEEPPPLGRPVRCRPSCGQGNPLRQDTR